MLEPCNVVKCLGHSMALFPVLCVFSMYSDETIWRPRLIYILETPGNGISETLKTFKMSLDASALRNLCLWCEFQSCLLFIISLLLENFLTALDLSQSEMEKYFEWVIMLQRLVLACENILFSSLFIAGDVSHGGTSATQQQKFHTDDVKSVQNPVRSADWLTQQLHFFKPLFMNDRQKTKGHIGQM